MKSQIVGTFISDDVNLFTELISHRYNLINDTVFIFEIEDSHQHIVTYKLKRPFVLLPNSLLLHRNNSTNTLFTINAMNRLIEKCNNGKFIENYMLDWSLYTDMLLTIDNDIIKKTDINLISIEKKLPKNLQR